MKQVEISDLLLSANVVISVGYSTSIFEAQVLEKPVISVKIEHDVYGIPETISNIVDNKKFNANKVREGGKVVFSERLE